MSFILFIYFWEKGVKLLTLDLINFAFTIPLIVVCLFVCLLVSLLVIIKIHLKKTYHVTRLISGFYFYLSDSVNVSTATNTIGDTIFTVTSADVENDQISYSMSCSPATPTCPFQIFDCKSWKYFKRLFCNKLHKIIAHKN